MAKIMFFIDGTWVYATVPALAKSYGRDFQIDFGALPSVLAQTLQKQIGSSPVEVVRTCLFGSYAANFDDQDGEAVERRLDFFDMLREEYSYEVETYPVNFKGRRLRKVDRAPNDVFEPKEK